MEIKEKPLLTAKEFAKYAGIGLGQAYQLMSRADFPVVSFNRRKYVSVRNFEKWIDAQVESRRSELTGEESAATA